jgi:hypothetical protein
MNEGQKGIVLSYDAVSFMVLLYYRFSLLLRAEMPSPTFPSTHAPDHSTNSHLERLALLFLAAKTDFSETLIMLI